MILKEAKNMSKQYDDSINYRLFIVDRFKGSAEYE